MVVFALYLTYESEDSPRKVAEYCSKEQLLSVLDRHMMLAEVFSFTIVPSVYPDHFKLHMYEYTL